MDEEKYQQTKQILSNLREVKLNYWNALLTLNGILISVFSVFLALTESNKIIVAILVILSIFSASLIVVISKRIVRCYELILKSEDYENLPIEEFDKKLEEDQSQADIDYRFINCSEKGVEVISVIQILLIFLFVILNI